MADHVCLWHFHGHSWNLGPPVDVRFQQVFDLTAHPEQIQFAYGFYVLFFAIGFGLLAIAIVLLRYRLRGRKRVLAFALFWLGLLAFVAFEEFGEIGRMRALVGNGDYAEVEGCLQVFHPGNAVPTRGAGGEYWRVEGVRFEYGAGAIRPGYQLVEPNGGAVHPDTRVRVAFVTGQSLWRNLIVKLEVAQHACPPAPDVPGS
jgi:hypothetical protein